MSLIAPSQDSRSLSLSPSLFLPLSVSLSLSPSLPLSGGWTQGLEPLRKKLELYKRDPTNQDVVKRGLTIQNSFTKKSWLFRGPPWASERSRKVIVLFPWESEESMRRVERFEFNNVEMGWLRLVGSLKWSVSFAKETHKRDDNLQKRPIILRSLLIVATPDGNLYCSSRVVGLALIFLPGQEWGSRSRTWRREPPPQQPWRALALSDTPSHTPSLAPSLAEQAV